MIGALRYILAGCLTLALIASGVPSVRMVSAAPVQQAVHVHDHGDMHDAVLQHDAMPAMPMHAESRMPAKKSADSCKDMTCCTMCAMAYVEPMSRTFMPVRVALAVCYADRKTWLAAEAIFLDPGIPIAS